MATRTSVHTIRHLADEPFFIQCAENLKGPDGLQAATITSIDGISLENRETTDPQTWSEAADGGAFSWSRSATIGRQGSRTT